MLGLGFAVFAVAMVFWTTWGVMVISGWNELAERFRYSGKFKGRIYRFRAGGPSRWPPIGESSAIGTLSVGMNDDGLYVVPMIPFRLFHQPLLIPWTEIRAAPYVRLFFLGYRVSVRSVPDVALYFHGWWFYDAAPHLGDLRPH